MKLDNKYLKVLLPIIVLVVSLVAAKIIISTKSGTKRHAPLPVTTSVEAVRLKVQDYRVVLETQGTVRARTESELIPEVSGLVVKVSEDFREGGFFEKGDFLLQIDTRNYEAGVAAARHELKRAEQELIEETARSEQARRNWDRLAADRGEEPGELTLRKPQLATARAALDAAETSLVRAELDLARTTIKAPYAGRVLTKAADVGQYVSPGGGGVIAQIYAVDYAEVRLPLSGRQLEFLDLTGLGQTFRGSKAKQNSRQPRVTLSQRAGNRTHKWQGRVVRAAGAIDLRSRQLFVVARVKDPYGKKASGAPPLKVGSFVTARIDGRLLKDVVVVPRRALREGSEVLTVEDNKLLRKKVKVVWKDKSSVVVKDGLAKGELVVVSPVAFSVSGTPVKVTVQGEEKEPKQKESRKKQVSIPKK